MKNYTKITIDELKDVLSMLDIGEEITFSPISNIENYNVLHSASILNIYNGYCLLLGQRSGGNFSAYDVTKGDVVNYTNVTNHITQYLYTDFLLADPVVEILTGSLLAVADRFFNKAEGDGSSILQSLLFCHFILNLIIKGSSIDIPDNITNKLQPVDQIMRGKKIFDRSIKKVYGVHALKITLNDCIKEIGAFLFIEKMKEMSYDVQKLEKGIYDFEPSVNFN